MPVAPHGDGRCADRAAEVERNDLRRAVAAELQRDERQQDRLTGARRSDDQRVADISNMQRKPEWRGTFSLAEEQWGRLEVVIPHLSGPYGR